MLHHPQFQPHLRVASVPGEGVYVLAGTHQTLLKGRLYELVAPLVGDGRSADDICDQLEGQATPAEVYFVLGQLEKKGLLCELEASLPTAEAALWSAQQVDPRTAAQRLAETPVAVHAFGVEAGPFRDLLGALGVRIEDDARLSVVLVDDYLRGDLEPFNADAMREGRPWLLVRPLGRQVWVGPWFRPGVTGCWGCLAQRLRANHPVDSYLELKGGNLPGPGADGASSPATLQVAMGLAAHAVATRIVRDAVPPLEAKIQAFDLISWTVQTHTLVRLPYCRACGVSSGEADADGAIRPVVLEGHRQAVARDGGHRVVPPEVTLERYGHHVSPLTGAVTLLERVGSARDGAMHVYLAGHNLARRHRSLAHLRGDLRSMSSGKGTTDLQAKASGLCEGLERYSAVFRGDEPRRRARLAALGDSAISPDRCLLFSARQYRDREAWNARTSPFNHVPAPFDPEVEIEWTPAWSLTRQEPRYLATAFCYFHYPFREGEPFCVADSNGNAAGNTLEEAILQGFCELVERDSVALWWYNRVQRPGVDLDSFADPYLDRLRDELRGLGRTLWVLDLTSDLGVPVFAALTREAERPEERIVLGFGAHLDAHVALMRAVTEMNQMLSHLPPESAGDGSDGTITDRETLHWLRTATVANQPYLLPDPGVPPRTAGMLPRSASENVTEDVRACQGLVERLGMEMLVLDQTRPEIGLPVAKVVVPGLRHFWARFAPGRLYEVPVRLGWLPRPVPEEELNPIPMFL